VSARASSAELERFRSLIAGRLGIWFDDARFDFLAEVLERRSVALGEALPRYLTRLEAASRSAPELREIAPEITVGESYFFRHSDQFRAFSEIALPNRFEAQSATRRLRILSAGCSAGEEAYTLSILTQLRAPDDRWQIAITGVDVNPAAVQRAELGRYSAWALRETPADVQRQWFEADGREFVLANSIRRSVRFEERNLIGDDVWGAEVFDIVFCRNVLMYFTRENAACAVRKLSRALAPGGYLFLGHAENLRGLSLDFELRHTHDTFYYQRKAELSYSSPTPGASLPGTRAPPEGSDWTRTWLETVERSSARIKELTSPPLSGAPNAVPVPVGAVPELRLALELLANERFSEALDVLQTLPKNSAQNADTLLLRAALLTHSGRLSAAEAACAELIALDGLNAGAHYLHGLCREREGDASAAVEHAQIASYLDPAFAMPHLHLGLMARRTGERATAQRELNQAALLLQCEDASRLLLFGGGFQRDGLIALCRSELDRLKAAP
jgi:chemotaxis protein methyltransferase CheR